MTGRAEPTVEEQRAKLHKRMFLLESGPGSRTDKRFNREGFSNNNVDVVTTGELLKKKKKGSKVAGAVAGGAAAGAVGGAAAGAAAGTAASTGAS